MEPGACYGQSWKGVGTKGIKALRKGVGPAMDGATAMAGAAAIVDSASILGDSWESQWRKRGNQTSEGDEDINREGGRTNLHVREET